VVAGLDLSNVSRSSGSSGGLGAETARALDAARATLTARDAARARPPPRRPSVDRQREGRRGRLELMSQGRRARSRRARRKRRCYQQRGRDGVRSRYRERKSQFIPITSATCSPACSALLVAARRARDLRELARSRFSPVVFDDIR
jgi:hypothetical protein